jgi:transposase
MKWRLGGPEAVTATAHKLARIIYHLLSTKQPYSESLLVQCDRQESTRAEMRLRKHAANHGYMLSPIPEIS